MISSEIKIDVQSEEFDKFRKAFDAYNAALESMPATWRGVATQAAGAKTSFEASANALALQATHAQTISGHVTKLTQTSGMLARHWHQMHLSTSGVATHIKDMTTSLQSWAGTLGKLALGGAGIAGLGFWGMEAMGRGVMGKRIQAGGFGTSIGGLQSFQTNYARLGSTDEMLGGATTAKSKINSQERQALINLGISNQDIDRLPADELAALEVRKFKEFSNGIKDDSLFYTRADALGIPLSHETMQRIRGTSGEELGAIENQRRADKPKMDIPPATARKWTDFENAVAETAATLKNKFEVKLSVLADPLSKLSTGVGKLADEFIDKDLGPWIDGLASGLDLMTKAVGTDEAKGAMTGFIADVKAMTQGTIGLVHGLASAARWLGISTPAVASTPEAAGKTSAPFGMGPLQTGQSWPGGGTTAPAGMGPLQAGQAWPGKRASAGESQEVIDFIRKEAIARGINPDTAVAVARSEGLRGFDPSKGRWSTGSNDAGTSFGPFQLHYASNIPGFRARGLGDDFTRDTGLDARKMENWKAATDYALDHAKKEHSWRAWHGFNRRPASEGLDYRPPAAPAPVKKKVSIRSMPGSDVFAQSYATATATV